MDGLDYILLVFLSISLAELSIQIVISDLSHWVKGAILLNQPYNEKLNALCTRTFWQKLFNKAWIIATPFILLVRLHRFFSQLFSCPWCTAFWLMLCTNFFYLQLPVVESLLLAPLALVFVTVLDKLHS